MPEYGGDNTEQDEKFYSELYYKFEDFLAMMEDVKIKEALKIAMLMSSLCNAYMQDHAPWKLAKAGPKQNLPRCNQVMYTAI